MKVAEAIENRPGSEGSELVLQLPLGLLGFERMKSYVLTAEADQAPFAWLQVQNDPKLAFLVISPSEVLPGYSPDISQDDVAFLGLQRPADASLLCIVTLRPNQVPTVNLKGPVVINRHTLVGKQVIPVNAAELSVQHPLPVAAA